MPEDPTSRSDVDHDAPYAPLQDALARAVSTPPWWQRWRIRLPHRGRYPMLAALSAVLLLSLLGVAAPWNGGTPRGGDWRGPGGPVLLSPQPSPADPPSIVSRPGAAETAAPGAGADQSPCQQPLSVVAAPDITDLVREVAGPLVGGSCPQVTVNAQDPATTLNGGDAPDLWLPDSSLWLRLAGSSDRRDLPATGTSIARSPVVLAVPDPVADALAEQQAWPVWLVFYEQVTSGEIPRMSMADPETTVGALALVAFAEAVDYHWGADGDRATFLRTIHFRDSLAATDADPAALLSRLASTPRAQSSTQVGIFPVTEQRLLSYQDQHPGMPVVARGTHEAMSEADYPVAVSASLDNRLAGIAEELLAQLRSPVMVRRLVELGFRPPRGSSTQPAALADTNRFPEYPDPVALPDAAGWRAIVDTWTWTG